MRENVHKWHIKPAIRPQASLRATVFSQKMVRRKFLFTEPGAVIFAGGFFDQLDQSITSVKNNFPSWFMNHEKLFFFGYD
ncbi:Uncharacterised protein [Legionella spiritensis]|nr:Uncharacterised protein [Legionella spiritensis]